MSTLHYYKMFGQDVRKIYLGAMANRNAVSRAIQGRYMYAVERISAYIQYIYNCPIILQLQKRNISNYHLDYICSSVTDWYIYQTWMKSLKTCPSSLQDLYYSVLVFCVLQSGFPRRNSMWLLWFMDLDLGCAHWSPHPCNFVIWDFPLSIKIRVNHPILP